MRVILADLKATRGLVAKDTVAGGYGSRLVPFSRVTHVYAHFKGHHLEMPSIQMGYLAAIFARHGHEVIFVSRGQAPPADVAVVLSSLVDYRQETGWADQARRRGIYVGFVGLAASRMPEWFRDHADFLIVGEPEEAARRLASGQRLSGICPSAPVSDLDSLPFPRWDLLRDRRGASGRLRRIPVLASRSCTESCTYCPHRVLAPFRARSVGNVADELESLCAQQPMPHVVFRDPLFTQDRDRCLALCEEIKPESLLCASIVKHASTCLMRSCLAQCARRDSARSPSA